MLSEWQIYVGAQVKERGLPVMFQRDVLRRIMRLESSLTYVSPPKCHRLPDVVVRHNVHQSV